MLRHSVLCGLLLFAPPAVATVARSWNPETIVENPRYCSPNGRFCFVVREFAGVGDFARVRADRVFRFDEEGVHIIPPRKHVGALYEIDGRTPRRLAVIDLGEPRAQEFLVSDSGSHVVAKAWSFDDHYAPGDPLLTIYGRDGSVVRRFLARDLITPHDLQAMSFDRHAPAVALEPDVARVEHVRIDLATGALLDEVRDRYPSRRIWFEPDTETRPAPADPHTIVIPSSELLARAVHGVLPADPEVARKARIGGTVHATITVSESGSVLDVQVTPLPFGVSEAVAHAVKQWTFAPYMLGGQPVKVASAIAFHFRPITPERWREVERAMSAASPRAELVPH